jgi:hypothetical protein
MAVAETLDTRPYVSVVNTGTLEALP